MTFGDVLKRLPATVVLLCGYAVSFITFKDNWETLSDASLAVRILLPFAAFALLTGSYLFSVLKDKKLLFRLVSLAAVFCCNVFSSGGTLAQTVLVIAFALDLAAENIKIDRFPNFAITLVAFFVSASLATLTIPYLQRVKTPQMVTDIEETWFSLIEEIRDSQPQQTIEQNEQSDVETEAGGLTGNVITNDPFDPEDPVVSLTVLSSAHIDKLMVFACYDYDPENTKFYLPSPDAEVSNSSTAYYHKALSGEDSGGFVHTLDIEDASIYTDIRAVPFCDFESDGFARALRDSYLFRDSLDRPFNYRYYIDPDGFYDPEVPGYSDYVMYRYTSLPFEFRQVLMDFLDSHGIEADLKNRYRTVREICTMLEGYTYSNEPPALPEGEDPILWFLTVSRTGYSKHFAAAEVLLFRMLGIPARYCYGYLFDAPAGERVTITEGNAYAFCQVYLDGRWMIASEVKETDKQEESLPENEGPQIHIEIDPIEEARKERVRIVKKAALIAVPCALLLAVLIFLCRRFRPGIVQRIDISYKALTSFYFIRDEIRNCMIKSRYSKEGPTEEDALLLESEVGKAKGLYLYKKNLIKLSALCLYILSQKLRAVAYNMFRRQGKEGR